MTRWLTFAALFSLIAAGCAETPTPTDPTSGAIDSPAAARKARLVYMALPEKLPLGNGFENGFATAINSSGVVVGWAHRDGEPPQAVLWRGGDLVELQALGGGSSAAQDINERGEVVGWSETSDGAVRAVVWRNGVPEGIGPAGSAYGTAEGINNRGQIVGSIENESGERNAFLVWRGRLEDLGRLPGSGFSVAEDINNRGDVVGWSASGCCVTQRATLWRGGEVRDLGTLQFESAAFAINERGTIVGGSIVDFFSHVVSWEHGEIRDLGLDGSANDINNRGQIVGSANLPECAQCPFLWERGMLIELSPGSSGNAQGISNPGRIAGYVGVGTPEGPTPVVWKTAGRLRSIPGLSAADAVSRPVGASDAVRSPTMRDAAARAICETQSRVAAGVSALAVAAGC